jgi:GTP cyclohydrolase I/GTP cyclohydrolase-4
VSLSRVGVNETEKVVRLITPEGEHPYHATFECVVELAGDQKGAHMSRFEEVINETIGELVVSASTTLRAEHLAAHIAEVVRDRQQARRAEVTMVARYPENKPAPVSGIATQEIYTLLATASATDRGTRQIIGVQAQGMTACPCAQGLIEASSRERLLADGFTDDEIERVFAAVPVATHNQRGLGTLEIGLPAGAGVQLDARQLVQIVENSMSSEIFELMKRSDEGAVVERAHRNPRFVEDCVREMIAGVVDLLPQLGDDVWIGTRQENLETIHQHNVIAERFGVLGEIRSELAGEEPSAPRHLGRAAWLDQG